MVALGSRFRSFLLVRSAALRGSQRMCSSEAASTPLSTKEDPSWWKKLQTMSNEHRGMLAVLVAAGGGYFAYAKNKDDTEFVRTKTERLDKKMDKQFSEQSTQFNEQFKELNDKLINLEKSLGVQLKARDDTVSAMNAKNDLVMNLMNASNDRYAAFGERLARIEQRTSPE